MEVVIPSTVTKIEEGAFVGCISLTSIIIPDTVEVIETGAFELETLKIHTPVLEEEIPEGWAEGWNGEAEIDWGYEVPKEPERKEEEKNKLGWL